MSKLAATFPMTETRFETQNPSECLADFLPAFFLCQLESQSRNGGMLLPCWKHVGNTSLLPPLSSRWLRWLSWWPQEAQESTMVMPGSLCYSASCSGISVAVYLLTKLSGLKVFFIIDEHLSDTKGKVRLRSKARKQKLWNRAELQVWTWSSHEKN